jgi:hypothetical protein
VKRFQAGTDVQWQWLRATRHSRPAVGGSIPAGLMVKFAIHAGISVNPGLLKQQ